MMNCNLLGAWYIVTNSSSLREIREPVELGWPKKNLFCSVFNASINYIKYFAHMTDGSNVRSIRSH